MSRHDLETITAADLAMRVGARVVGDPSATLRGITQDSRDVRAGDAFCCVRGARTDGHDHAPDAVRAGATVLVCDREIGPDELGVAAGVVTQLIVDDVRSRLGVIADAVFGHPARSLRLFGVTGTNGKTSTVAILASILEAAGSHTLSIGTLTGERTTPEALDLHGRLRDALRSGVDTVVMEVSSHALVMGRVSGIVFEAAIFTNLSRDHLDFHGDMESYFRAKQMLFSPERCRLAVVNLDDPYGRRLADEAKVPVTGFSPAGLGGVLCDANSVRFSHADRVFSVPIGGRFTLANALAAVTAAQSCGVDLDAIEAGCAQVAAPAGRFQVVPNDRGISVIVDYAHTPEGLDALLISAREVCRGRVIVVVGCGGDRDQGKRAPMGEAAARGSDVVVVTSDNPRNENPMSIIDAVVDGVRAAGGDPIVEPDRALAIASAISAAKRGDMVVIAGKGHETTQEIAGIHHRFVDAEVAAAVLGAQKGGGA